MEMKVIFQEEQLFVIGTLPFFLNIIIQSSLYIYYTPTQFLHVKVNIRSTLLVLSFLVCVWNRLCC